VFPPKGASFAPCARVDLTCLSNGDGPVLPLPQPGEASCTSPPPQVWLLRRSSCTHRNLGFSSCKIFIPLWGCSAAIPMCTSSPQCDDLLSQRYAIDCPFPLHAYSRCLCVHVARLRSSIGALEGADLYTRVQNPNQVLLSTLLQAH